MDSLIYGIAFHEVVLDDISCPDTEGSTTFTMNTIADGDNDIEVVKNMFLNLCLSL